MPNHRYLLKGVMVMKIKTNIAAAGEGKISSRAFSGYASVFSLTDLSGDIIEPGAFSASLRRSGSIRMLWQHQADNPIGIWTKISEDQRGLYVEGVLTQGVMRADEAWQLIANGALDGLSIGFRTKRSKKAASNGKRHILEADLWEISLVTFPMLPQARVTAIQSKNRSEMPERATAEIIRQAAFRLQENTHY